MNRDHDLAESIILFRDRNLAIQAENDAARLAGQKANGCDRCGGTEWFTTEHGYDECHRCYYGY